MNIREESQQIDNISQRKIQKGLRSFFKRKKKGIIKSIKCDEVY